MLITDSGSQSPWAKVVLLCDDCKKEYPGRLGTAQKQQRELGKHQCRSCRQRDVLAKVKKDPDFGKKISQAKKGVALTESHKQSLRGITHAVSEETKVRLRQQLKNRWEGHDNLTTPVNLCCGICGEDYRTRMGTAYSQVQEFGVNMCLRCRSRLTGKKTASGRVEILREQMLSDNIAKRPGVRAKISAKRKGVPLTDDHKKALRKPKSKTDKIREAANRPEERERRSRRMAEWISQFPDPAKGWFKLCHRGYVETNKTANKIYCRSGLEMKFLALASLCGAVKSIASAEQIYIIYHHDGHRRRYLPDFFVYLENGDKFVVEIKAPILVNEPKTQSKMNALVEWARQDNYSTKMLTTVQEIKAWLAQL